MSRLLMLMAGFCIAKAANDTFNIGYIYSAEEGQITSLAVLQMAEKDLRDRGVVGPNITFIYHPGIFSAAVGSESTAVIAAAQIRCQYGADLFIGPYWGLAMIPMVGATTIWDTLVISQQATLDVLANSTLYPALARLSNALGAAGKAIGKLLAKHKWTSIALITSPGCADVYDAVVNNLGPNITILLEVVFSSTSPKQAEILSVLNKLKSSARVSIVCLTYNPWELRPFMVAAMQQNMTDSSYAYILPYPAKSTIIQPLPWTATSGVDSSSVTDDVAKLAFASTLVIEPLDSDEAVLTKAQQLIDNFSNAEPYLSMGIRLENPSLTVFRSQLYDSMYLYGLALNTCISAGAQNTTRSGQLLFNCIIYQSWAGLTGEIAINANGDKSSVYTVKSFDANGQFTPLYKINANDHLCIADESRTGAVQIEIRIGAGGSYRLKKWICLDYISTIRDPYWRTATNQPPLAVPICGFRGELCISPDYVAIGVGLGAAIIVVIATAIYWRHRRKKLKLLDELNTSWKLFRKDITFMSSGVSKSMRSKSENGSQMSFSWKSKAASTDIEALKNGQFVSAMHLGNQVSTRAYYRIRSFDLTAADMQTFKRIFEVNHENLNRFVGIVIDSESDILIVWNYCSKGTLTALLKDSDMDLDYAFKSSLIRDIVSGLDYLHNKSQLQFHGNLNSTNCVITSRWVAVLTDFGLDRIFNSRLHDGIVTKTAPDAETPIVTDAIALGSKQQDIYAFGEILFEVITREDLPKGRLEAILVLTNLANLGPLLRDTSEKGNVNTPILELFKMCRTMTPGDRPLIAEIKSVLQTSSYVKKNLLDHMFGIMEKYASSLEGIVSERTALLQEERRRADSLLYQMLPRTVADALKRGESVLPEMYDSATIYFSDIVGFTTICSDSSPIQVVDMLNSLYNQFDAIINAHDCYKVETIGDAYLVVSGVPKRNGDKHVTEVCDMSIEIMKFVATYAIPHMKDRRMSIRIGIHSGPVAAGVIGLSMPRYCLFGDSVNVASRMESHGLALKIHLSWSSAALLQKSNDYQLDSRGEIFIKGKGICQTFWLEGKMGDIPDVSFLQ